MLLAAVVLLAAAGWVLSGQFGSSADDGKTPPPKAALPAASPSDPVLPPVRARILVAEPREVQVVVRGRTEVRRSVEVKAELPGRVTQVLVDKGTRVKAGDVLVKLAVDDRAAWLAEAEAAVRQRQIEYTAAKALAEKGYRAETKLAEAAALLDAAKAKVKRMEVEIAKLTIRAPFDGVVETRAAELGAFLKDGNPVATVVDEDPFLVVAQVSERDVGRLKVGQPGRARLVTGEEVEGRLRFIATSADAATRTFRVELEVPNRERTLRDGVTAELMLAAETVPAHFVSPAVLTLNEKGVVGVRTVDSGGAVDFRPVTIVADTINGVWITGLPERVTVITVGQESVKTGDRVRVTLEAKTTS